MQSEQINKFVASVCAMLYLKLSELHNGHNMMHNVRKHTFLHVHPRKIEVGMRIRAIICFSCLHGETVITKTYLYNYDPLKPHFYVIELGLQGDILLFPLKNIDCGYLLELPHQGGSNE